MSTFIHLMPQAFEGETAAATAEPQEVAASNPVVREMKSFADEQIAGLVRQVYLTGAKPARQVVFSSVDRETRISGLCQRIAGALSEQASGTTCWLNANFRTRDSEFAEARRFQTGDDLKRFGGLRDASQQLSNQLWYMPAEVFLGEGNGLSTSCLRARLAELRLEFDHVVIQGSTCGATNQASLLAGMCDGMVLVLEANVTRRVSARKVKETLDAAHVRLLGTVLSERRFPIPHAIYKRV
jgi:hypothetical protein